MFKFRHGDNIYVRWGVTAFLTVIAILAVYDIFFGMHKIAGYLSVLNAVFMPVACGAAIAYLLAPIVDFLERTVLRPWAAQGVAERKPQGWVRLVSVLLTLFIVLGLIALLLCFLIQDVVTSIMQLADNIPMYVAVVQGWMQGAEGSVTLPPEIMEQGQSLYDRAMNALQNITSTGGSDMISAITGGVAGVIGFFANLIVGIVIAAYMLGMKEKLAAQGKKILCALLEKKYLEKMMDAVHYTDEVFGGFIRGNILVSTIIGVICFVSFQFMGIPYAPLLSVLIGVTNLIPFFGPFLGAIPSCILIFLVSPIKCLEFIIFILILQQLDGNILTPRILGQSTGLASLWVIISVLVGGGLFGPLGMLLGCPAFALIYALIRLEVGKGLEKKNLPVATDAYRSGGIPNPEQDTQNRE